MKRDELLLICFIFLVAFFLRFYDVASPSFRYMDENGHVMAASNYWQNGQTEPDNWEHPPLRHILLYGFLQLFGDNPYGWRIRNVLFGAATAVLLYFFARSVTKSRKTALMAGLLLATDPLHLVLSRHTFCEVYGAALCLAAVLFYVMHKGRSSYLLISAIFMACAVATKWNYVPCWLLIFLLTLYEQDNYRDLRSALFVTGIYILVPVSIYILAYYPWFGRGYSLAEFGDHILNVYFSFQRYRPESYDPQLIFLGQTSAWEWFIRPIALGHGHVPDGDTVSYFIYTNNLPVWILTLPAMLVMAIVAVRRRSMTIALPVLLFGASYLLFLSISRPAFLYSAGPLLPFAFTAVAYGISEIALRYGARWYYLALALMISWNMYLFPLVTGKKVPMALYYDILKYVRMTVE